VGIRIKKWTPPGLLFFFYSKPTFAWAYQNERVDVLGRPEIRKVKIG